MEGDNFEETAVPVASASPQQEPVISYDEMFPVLSGNLNKGPGAQYPPAQTNQWSSKMRVSTSSVTQVRQFLIRAICFKLENHCGLSQARLNHFVVFFLCLVLSLNLIFYIFELPRIFHLRIFFM